MNVTAIINPLSGAGTDPREAARRIARLTDRFRAGGIDGTIVLTERAGHAREIAAAAVARGADVVVVWGGDGTVNEVGSVVAGTAVSLGIVPAGSGNGLASAIGVPRDPDQALRVALHGTTRVIDAGDMGGRLFFNIAGIGVDAAIARRFNRLARGRRGMGPYLRIGIHEAWRYRSARYRIRLDGDTLEADALLIAFANGPEYGNRARIAPHASLDDGRLEAVVVADRHAVARVWSGRHLIFGTAQRAPGVLCRSIECATIETDGPIGYHVDGEPDEAGGSIAVRVRRGVLRVRVPRKETDG
ncbi:MAG TPA: diacylglycerol kinase family protein [Vicinamibacterales bacterium]|nr:diacylglycerol kinase family protein [Vicinamibacterales bacterium]